MSSACGAADTGAGLIDTGAAARGLGAAGGTEGCFLAAGGGSAARACAAAGGGDVAAGFVCVVDGDAAGDAVSGVMMLTGGIDAALGKSMDVGLPMGIEDPGIRPAGGVAEAEAVGAAQLAEYLAITVS